MSQLISPASSPYTRNPKHMPLGNYSALKGKSAAATVFQLASAGSFTPLALGGAATTVAANNTYYTICDITGAGFLTAVIGALGAGPHTPTFQITVDGVAYVIAPSTTIEISNRMMLGSVGYRQAIGSGTTAATIAHFEGIGSAFDEGFANAKTGGLWQNTSACVVPTPHQVLSMNLAKLRFDASLKVEVKDSNVSATADPGQKCCALYLLDL